MWSVAINGPFILTFIGTVCAGLSILALWQQRARRRHRLQIELDRLRNDFALVQAGNIGLGKALMRLQRQLEGLRESAGADGGGPTVETVAGGSGASGPANDDPGFDRAEVLLRSGAPLDQVVRETGLTRSEVELMSLLQHPGYAVGPT